MDQSLDVFKEEDYRAILKREFEIRRLRRPSYSVRAFARDLGLNSSRLSAILGGRYGMSADTARAIAEKLHYNEEQAAYFVDLVESKHSRTRIAREQARMRVLSSYRADLFEAIDDSKLDLLSKWHHAAVLEIMSSQNIFNTQKIAELLRTSVSEVDESIRLLLRLGLMTKKQYGYEVKDEFLVAWGPTPKPTIRKYHREVLEQVKEAIDREPVNARKNLSTIFAFDSEKTEAARAWLDKMHKAFIKEFGSAEKKDSIMALGVHLVPITEKIANE